MGASQMELPAKRARDEDDDDEEKTWTQLIGQRTDSLAEPSEDLLERQEISQLKGSLTCKSEWEAKIWDNEIVGKWRSEATEMGAKHFDRALEELRSSDYFNRHGLAYVDGIVPAPLA